MLLLLFRSTRSINSQLKMFIASVSLVSEVLNGPQFDVTRH